MVFTFMMEAGIGMRFYKPVVFTLATCLSILPPWLFARYSLAQRVILG